MRLQSKKTFKIKALYLLFGSGGKGFLRFAAACIASASGIVEA